MEHCADTRVLKTDLLEIWNNIKCHLQQGSVEGSDTAGYLKNKTEKTRLFCIKQLSLNHAKSC